MLQSVPFNMPLNNDIKRLEIRFFRLIFFNMFRTSILGKLGPPFQQSFTPKLLRALQWLKATLSIGTGFEFPQISIKTDFSHRSRLFTGLHWLPAILLFAWSTPNTLQNLRVRMRCIYPPPSNSFSSPKYTLANEAARSIPLIIPATSRTSPISPTCGPDPMHVMVQLSKLRGVFWGFLVGRLRRGASVTCEVAYRVRMEPLRGGNQSPLRADGPRCGCGPTVSSQGGG